MQNHVAMQHRSCVLFLLTLFSGHESVAQEVIGNIKVALQRKQQVNNYIHALFIIIEIDRLISIAVIQILRRVLSVMAANEDSR